MAHFYGSAYEENYEKEIKDFTPLDWIITVIGALLIIGAVVSGVLFRWGLLMIFVGTAIIWIDVLLHIVMHVKSKILKYFDAMGVLVVIGGILWCIGGGGWAAVYGFSMIGVIWLFVGALCTSLGIKEKKKFKKYSCEVNATCEIVDVQKTNLFRFDDINSGYFNPNNKDDIFKPAFHYVVNGVEYYTESKVYYGDMNTDFREGNQITLRVNPQNPNEILPKNSSTSLFFFMGIFSLILGLGYSIVYVILFMNDVFISFL